MFILVILYKHNYIILQFDSIAIMFSFTYDCFRADNDMYTPLQVSQ